MRARLAAVCKADAADVVWWLKTTIALDPAHADATRLLESYLDAASGGSSLDPL
jgi:hypothetical protein